ncbi:Solitary outer membrane autotransporter beta-barrel domain [Shewanella sp. Isolate7]|uniref:Solitary outer membrane autotransporter beta-barrel domain n=1 Tax=Shewanella sp. Isolate7 TaxID=2908528 RepID=UPI001EFC8A5C|nr:Solitary outer membrane autotransporter beta-barrel domain [Shewanella sp. Isolate7]
MRIKGHIHLKSALIRWLGLCVGVYLTQALAAAEINLRPAVEAKLKGDITSAMVLTDANLITLGIVDFNPNTIVDLSEIGDVGSEESLERRSQLTSYTLPWESEPVILSPHTTGSIQVRLSYVHASDSIQGLEDETISSPLEDTSYLLAGEYRWKYQINPQWRAMFGLGAQLLWLENTLTYKDPLLSSIRGQLDEKLVNTSYGAIMLDPNVEVSYTGDLLGNKWEFISTLRYGIGRSVLTDDGMQAVTPQVGRLSNALVFHYGLPDFFERQNEMRLLAKRIDLSGDVIDSMGTRHYYEFGAGWVVQTPSLSSWLRNIGIGITLNINSGLSGGGIVLLFNEEM